MGKRHAFPASEYGRRELNEEECKRVHVEHDKTQSGRTECKPSSAVAATNRYVSSKVAAKDCEVFSEVAATKKVQCAVRGSWQTASGNRQ